MDLSKYKRIYGSEVVERLLSGEHLFTEDGTEWHYDELLWCRKDDQCFSGDTPFNRLVNDFWYIIKPFDVREVMRERPNEWVGKFKTKENDWIKVGFDESRFSAIGIALDSNKKVYRCRDIHALFLSESTLDACISIEDISEG